MPVAKAPTAEATESVGHAAACLTASKAIVMEPVVPKYGVTSNCSFGERKI